MQVELKNDSFQIWKLHEFSYRFEQYQRSHSMQHLTFLYKCARYCIDRSSNLNHIMIILHRTINVTSKLLLLLLEESLFQSDFFSWIPSHPDKNNDSRIWKDLSNDNPSLEMTKSLIIVLLCILPSYLLTWCVILDKVKE